MTADQRFTLIISGMGLLFMMLSAVIGLIYKAGNRSGQLTTEIGQLTKAITSIARDLDEHVKWHLTNSNSSRRR
jgi:hypothetical protein